MLINDDDDDDNSYMKLCTRTVYYTLHRATARASYNNVITFSFIIASRAWQHDARCAICYRLSVCQSVRLSHGWISQKQGGWLGRPNVGARGASLVSSPQ